MGGVHPARAVVLGLFTRIAAIGMIGFVIVLTWVDIMGHGAGPETIGAWFNNTSGDAILDQRAFWIFLLIVLVLRGAGPLSLDALLGRYREATTSPSRPSRGKAARRPVSITGRFISAGCAANSVGRRLRALSSDSPRQVVERVFTSFAPNASRKPRPRGIVQRRLPHVHQHRVVPRLAQPESPSGRYRSCAIRRPSRIALPPFSMICAN
jgi:hypothetical protein